MLAGIGIAFALRALLHAFGIPLPADELVLRPRTPVVAVLVGVVVTMVAAVAPALRSTRVPPVAALSAVAAPPQPRFSRLRYVVGALVGGAGVAVLSFGLFAGAGLPAVGTGTVLVFLGAAALSPLIVRPVIKVIGAPVARLLGVRGVLARENAMRNPRRTSSTAAALMIGLGLVGFVTIFAASLRASASDAVNELFTADLQVRSATFTGLPSQVAERLAALDETALVGTQKFGEARIGANASFVMAMDPATMDELFRLTMEQGRTADLTAGGILVSSRVAAREGWEVGDAVPVTFALTGQRRFTLRGVFDGSGHDIQYMIHEDTYRANFRDPQDWAVLLRWADGVDPADGRQAVEAAVADVPTAQITDQEGFREEISSQINQLLGLVFGLLFLSVVIALFGIVNTLALSVMERVRELGLLRAIGMTRGQVRSMVRWESVMVAVLGTVTGLALGVFFAWIVTLALEDQGLGRFVVPGGQLAVAVVVAALAGVLAGVLPARRAARVDVLRAITVE